MPPGCAGPTAPWLSHLLVWCLESSEKWVPKRGVRQPCNILLECPFHQQRSPSDRGRRNACVHAVKLHPLQPELTAALNPWVIDGNRCRLISGDFSGHRGKYPFDEPTQRLFVPSSGPE